MESNIRETMKNCLPIYEKFDDYIEEGIVIPYDDYLIEFLATNAPNKNSYYSYLDLLNSTSSIGNCFEYARYLALGMKEPFKLCEGNLSSLYDGYFPHGWIENDEYVYPIVLSNQNRS